MFEHLSAQGFSKVCPGSPHYEGTILSPLFKALDEFPFEFSGRMVSSLLEEVISGSHLHNSGEVSPRPDRNPLTGDFLTHDGVGLRLQPDAVDDRFFRA